MTTRAELPEKIEEALQDLVGYKTLSTGRTIEDYHPSIEELRAAIREALDEAEKRGAHNPSLKEALNSGDGVYRP